MEKNYTIYKMSSCGLLFRLKQHNIVKISLHLVSDLSSSILNIKLKDEIVKFLTALLMAFILANGQNETEDFTLGRNELNHLILLQMRDV